MDPLARIAQLEAELATYRGKDVLDKQAMNLNPVGYLHSKGINIEHVTKHFVANALGDQCPESLRAQVAAGPQIQATQQLGTSMEDLSRRLSVYESRDKLAATVGSLKTLTADKTKYPALADAVAKNPSLLESRIKALGDTADVNKVATDLEAEFSQFRSLYAPPSAPSQNTADNTFNSNTVTANDTNAVKPATAGTSNDVPPIPQAATPGAFTEDMHKQLRDSVLRKHNLIQK